MAISVDGVGMGPMEGMPADGIIGFRWDQNLSSPTLMHIDEYGNEVLGLTTADFDKHPIWGGMRRCTMAPDGSKHYGSNPRGDGLDLTGADGRVMVEIPKFYAKSLSPKANVYDFWFSPVPTPGFELFPAFLQRGGIERDNINVGAYQAGNTGTVLDSQTGDVVTVSQTIGTFRTWANNIGPRWGLVNPWSLSAMQLLYYIEYANADSQTMIGRGIVDAGAKSNTGASGMDVSPQMAINGTGMGCGTDGLVPIAYRGIENLWGNVWIFVDGWNAIGDAATGKYHIIRRDGLGNINDVDVNGMLNAGNYEVSVAIPTQTSNYIRNIVYEDLLKYLFIGDGAAGSATTYLCDFWYAHDNNENNILRFGGGWADGDWGGVADRHAADLAADAIPFLASRLEFI